MAIYGKLIKEGEKDEHISYLLVHPQVDGKFTVERGMMYPDDTKSGVTQQYDQDARYVEFSVKMVESNGYRLMG